MLPPPDALVQATERPPWYESLVCALGRALIRIDLREATFAKRGFLPGVPDQQLHLENIGVEFLNGFHRAVFAFDLRALISSLEALPARMRGFAFEGAAMALAICDGLSFG